MSARNIVILIIFQIKEMVIEYDFNVIHNKNENELTWNANKVRARVTAAHIPTAIRTASA